MDLPLRIVLENPPAGVDFGLQKGRGSNYETVQKQRSGAGDLLFEFTIKLKDGAGAPDFSGPFVQGPKGQRFVYLDIGTFAGQADSCWSRRLKIALNSITSALVKRTANDSQAVLEARIRGTGTDGGPSCGTVKAFTGWKAATR